MIIRTLKTGNDCTGLYVKEVQRIAASQGLSTVLEEIPYDIWTLARQNLNME